MRPAIILFAKAPIPGRVKTRLQPPLAAGTAAQLHRAFTADLLEKLQSLADLASVELHTDTETDAWSEFEVPKYVQIQGNLGDRMLHAMQMALSDGRPRVMIVGSDAPTLPVEFLTELLAADADLALGPAGDGGYYAIACRRVERAMFDAVEWSTGKTLAQTCTAARLCGLTVSLGREWYDIDTAAGLDRLIREPDLPPHTKRSLRDSGLI